MGIMRHVAPSYFGSLIYHKDPFLDCLLTTSKFLAYSPPEVDRIWGIWVSYYNIPTVIFYLLKGEDILSNY